MSQPVEDLRAQLRSLGYLSHGIERWFALDPWSSRTFWSELLFIALKAAAIVTPFAALPAATVMIIRNRPLGLYELLLVLLTYLISAFLAGAAVVLATAAILKIRPLAVIRRPSSLMWISLAEAAVMVGLTLMWWLAFPTPPSQPEFFVVIGLLLLFLPIGTVAFSAAILSFSIYETQQIPSIHRRPRTIPLTVAGVVLMALLLLVLPGARPHFAATDPQQVVVTPTTRRVALVAVDGLTREIFSVRASAREVPHLINLTQMPGRSAPENWASVGTGTGPELHGVRAIEAVRFAGSEKLLQSISRADLMLRYAAPLAGLARKQPLPPTVRERDYVWEIAGARGVRSAGINWWAGGDASEPGLRSISQESVYAAAARAPGTAPTELAINIDKVALDLTGSAANDPSLRLLAVYLPALDIILHRLELPTNASLASSVRVLDGIDSLLRELQNGGWDILLVGSDFAASGFPLRGDGSWMDVAPTILDLLGFPASREMPGVSLLPDSTQPRIRSYGGRRSRGAVTVDEEYYEKLKSLGYVQ